MCMRIDKSRQCYTPAQIDLLGPSRFRQLFDFRACPRCGNQSIAHQQRAIFDQAQVGKGIAAPWTMPAQRQQLRCTRDKQRIRQGPRIMPDCFRVAQALACACLSPLILSPLNGQVKMSPHEQGDILIESERVATSGGGFSMYQGGGGVCLSPRGGLLEGAPDKAPVETLAGKPGGGPGTPPSRPGPANPPSFD